MPLQDGGALREGLQDEVRGGGDGARVRGVEGEGYGPVEEVGERGEGLRGVGEV